MKNILYSIIFLVSVLFYSCTQEINIGDPYRHYPPYYGYYQCGQTNGNGQFVIGGYVNGQYQSRVLSPQSLTRAAVSATYNDQFSLYAWTKDSTVMNGYHGVFGITNNQATWGYTENVKYFDNFIDKYNFIGVIPQGNHTYNNGKVTVNAQSFTEDNATYDDREILYASTTVEKANYSTGASLEFNHLNSKVFIKFTSDDANTEILDYSPYTPEIPYQPAVPGTETYTKKTTKFIDELVAGNEVQVAIGFYGDGSPNLTSTQANPIYVGTNNTSYGWLAKDWLLSIKDAVNSQFVYYRLNAVANSTSKTETTEDWEAAASNKNIFMMKLADGVNATDFANGNDAFATALKAHQTDWVGGSPAGSFWATFEQAYAEGWRVIRINVSDANANKVLVFLSSNIEASTQVCEVTGGSPEIPYQPATGKPGIIMLPATSANQTGTDAVLATYPSDVNIELSLNDPVWAINSTSNTVTFTKPTGKVYTTQVASPTSWFTFPASVANTSNLGYTIKFSYKYKDITVYDARVFIPTNKCTWEAGKYYTYIINIKGRGNGHDTVIDPEGEDPVIEQITNHEITINQVNINDYTEGEEYEINVQ